MELSFSGTSWEVNDFKQNFGPFSGTELLVSTVVVIAGFWSGDVGGVEPEHSRVNSSQATLVRNIWGFFFSRFLKTRENDKIHNYVFF